MSTLKKVLLGISCVLALGGFIFGTDLFSYVSTACGKVRNAAKSSVPIEFEIQRARDAVTKLTPEIQENMRTIAQEDVDLNRLNETIAKLAASMKEMKSDMLTLQKALDGDKTKTSFTFAIPDHPYTRSEVEMDLLNRLGKYKSYDTELQTNIQMKAVREKSLQASKDKLQEYLSKQQQLGCRIAELEAKQKMIDVVKASSKYNFDQTALGQANELVDSLSRRIDIEEKVCGSNSGDLTNGVILSNQATKAKGVSQAVAEYLSKPSDPPKDAELVQTK